MIVFFTENCSSFAGHQAARAEQQQGRLETAPTKLTEIRVFFTF